jgi:hypothetical protein
MSLLLPTLFIKTVLGFYQKRSGGAKAGGKSGAVVSVQRTSSDLKLNPHLHAVFLDGAYLQAAALNTTNTTNTTNTEAADDTAPRFLGLGHLQTREVTEVLERAIIRMLRYCKQRKLLAQDSDEAEAEAQSAETRGHAELVASAVSGAYPPAGPSFPLRSPGLLAHPGTGAGARNTDFERPLCVGRDGFTLHAATRAGGADLAGREALLKYILRPAVAQERIIPGKDGLVRITLKRAFSDGTIAIDVDPLSLLCRLAAAVPYPRFHTVRYSGVLASASKLRPKIAPKQEPAAAEGDDACVHHARECEVPKRGPYRPWAELLKRTFNRHTHCNWHRGGVRPNPDHASVPS